MARQKSGQTLAIPKDSLAWRVVEFLKGNPGEELNRSDIAKKFSVDTSMIDTYLAPAVHAKLLARASDGVDEPTWRLIYPNVGFAPITGTLMAAKKAVHRFDLNSIKIESGVPKPEKAYRQRSWAQIFDQMKPGDSFQLPNEARPSGAKALQNYRKATGAYLVMVRVSATHSRIWREPNTGP